MFVANKNSQVKLFFDVIFIYIYIQVVCLQ